MSFPHKDTDKDIEDHDCDFPLKGYTCVIATAELNTQVEEELKIPDPQGEMASAAICENTIIWE